MDTRRIWPEIVFAGFLHLIWIVILFVNISKGSLTDIAIGIMKLSPGATALIGTAALGASFMVGLLTNRLLVALSQVLAGPSSEADLVRALDRAPNLEIALEDRSAHKALFRSGCCSVPMITIMMLPWAYANATQTVACAIILTGTMLTVAFVIAFVTQRKFHRQLLDAMLSHQA
jgi:hypothetical protein